ncbi:MULTISPECIES: gas vesicle protein GvpO [Priestia]|uniref:Gas vesicle protein GvpR n=5 Tax=Priestia TaxID=2800373 RepID=D5DYC9_PRIM1|nr:MULTISPECIES: gas vesicle protein GvpO [Priestia]AVX09208.1 gas vesicle protein GvpR [Bacillus sp. Y-01]KOP75340.1 gas vesicle protein GvpR [Bacillus sp. FJAT-21351]KQU16725.1 gas vesicle protein GvpR [Bacillus sp. Leaf75]KRD90514.1 gas vesicle protein GvpR [Bacillus sp. Root147]KRD99426.1 gas vesicle protein GvpR [Bacillus sp. Root239]KRF56637.1 gas vesicle protein GvpR [Bacillus sp. Soil531]MBU8851967.1 gas vesicle protein [Bacillus sp. FJAT-26377]MBZ5481664.1 gas vesicle protein [Baci
MKVAEIMESVTDFFKEHVAPPHRIISYESIQNGGWKITLEAFEEQEYMRRYAKDELLGIYEVLVNKQHNITSFSRTSLRYRSSPAEK